MSYLHDMQLRDLDESISLELTCPYCLHHWLESPNALLMRIFHREMYLDEVAQNLACRKPGCTHVGMQMRIIENDDTSAFVGGMP